jgi:hypothetical protein
MLKNLYRTCKQFYCEVDMGDRNGRGRKSPVHQQGKQSPTQRRAAGWDGQYKESRRLRRHRKMQQNKIGLPKNKSSEEEKTNAKGNSPPLGPFAPEVQIPRGK